MKNKSFISFTNALVILSELNITSVSEWRLWIKNNRDKNIPYNPEIVYKNSGWVDYYHFFNKKYKTKKFISYSDAVSLIKKVNIKDVSEWRLWIKINIDKNIPSSPKTVYKNEWVSWGEFLSNNNISNSKKLFRNYDDSKLYLSEYNLTGYEQFNKWYKENNIIDIPSNPHIQYKNNGWTSWGDFLSNNNITNRERSKLFITYTECKENISKENFKNAKHFSNWKNRPDYIPSAPSIFYKDKGWISWSDFLGNNVISNRERGKRYLSYIDAKSYLSNYNLSHKLYYMEYIANNNIDFLPKRPEYIYREFWTGYLDFLGCDGYRTSYGEKRIMEYLVNNNIEFIRERRFKTCKNTKELPFDFYLPHYNLCIEYDGEHHYHIVSKYGGQEYLDKIKINDKIKNEWCLINNINLLRISYKEKSKISKVLDEFLLSLLDDK
jgi:very-short-patch-repair endonuclease